ncbi:phospholipase [Aggregicoccus sp. 17bor-14]|uniref:phospholipase D-like domain-containing protein n=1 Tax=Myxococcaceae TaxID=31 RepID=UPI0012F0BE09|nr:phospholipase [Simulacricoccus sp. 17bor-14]MRI87492.1 phospholipase [Aggregicoccus sp. 17bor-14]
MKKIVSPGENCWAVAEASEAGVLVDARDYYRAFYHAAQKAKRYIVVTGWQFDSDVALLRGEDLKEAKSDVRMLPMLKELCEKNPELRVYILAWDFSLLLALEREWMQHILFNWTTSDQIVFRYDASSPLYAAHHQKLAVVDGVVAFTGGMDICDCRWDDRDHPAECQNRCDTGRDPHGPYHDVGAVLTGPIVRKLAELFEARWVKSGGGDLHLPEPLARDDVQLQYTLPLPPGPVAISRTFGRTLIPPQEAVQEVRALYLAAIDAAERFIYLENQYFSSRAIFQALVRRLRAEDRSKLDVVIVLPRQAEALREQVAMGVAQVKLMRRLQEVARETGHRLNVYCTAATDSAGNERFTYIHSKLLVVDDRFLTLGSANTTNRSMGLDSELNHSWESDSEASDALQRAIRKLRVSLLAEHTGLSERAALRAFARGEGMVTFLDRVGAARLGRLRLHPLDTVFDQKPVLKSFAPEDLLIDPEDSVLDEKLFETLKKDKEGYFASAVSLLTDIFVGKVTREPLASLPVQGGAAALAEAEADAEVEAELEAELSVGTPDAQAG